jgi:hypothetical protein
MRCTPPEGPSDRALSAWAVAQAARDWTVLHPVQLAPEGGVRMWVADIDEDGTCYGQQVLTVDGYDYPAGW